MTRWLGQLKREWLLMKSSLLLYAVLNLLVVLGGSVVTYRIFASSSIWFDHVLVIGGIWLVVGMFVGVGILYKSLEGEMKDPEVWLHSPATMLELVSVKIVFSVSATLLLLVWSEVIIVVGFVFSTTRLLVPYTEVVPMLGAVLLAFLAEATFIIGVGVFFWFVYRVLHTRTKTFGFVIAIGLFWVTTYLYGKVGIREALAKLWPLQVMEKPFTELPAQYFFVAVVGDSIVVSIGSILFYMVLTLVLIWSGAGLFERKARL